MLITVGITMILIIPVFTGIPEGPHIGVCILAGDTRDGDSDTPTDGPITVIPTIRHTGDGITMVTMIPGIHPGTHRGIMEDITAILPTTGDHSGEDITMGITTDSMTCTDHPAVTFMAGWITGIITGIPGHRMSGTEAQKVPHTLIPNTGAVRNPHVQPV